MKKKALLFAGLLIVLFEVVVLIRKNNAKETTDKSKETPEQVSLLQHIQGVTMGVVAYNVKYIGKDLQLKPSIDKMLKAFNQSLSTYIPESEISTLNREGKVQLKSKFLYPVLKRSKTIYEKTFHTFDPSIGPVIQAWGFDAKKPIAIPNAKLIDSLLQMTGMSKVRFDEQFVEIPKGMELNFSAIAKGYAVDLVGELLEEQGIEDYLVEIGGELRAKGMNQEEETWKVGIENPLVKIDEQKLFAVSRLRNRSLATSGNYRNYYKKNGKLIAHIIDPRTGYNTNHNLLSASVFAKDCLTADAYATAFMVLGFADSKKVLANNPNLDALFIFEGENGELQTYMTENIMGFIDLPQKKSN